MPETQTGLLQAIRLAGRARQHGNHPFGALPAASLSVVDLRAMTLYTSTEPCAMCSGFWNP